MAITYPRTELHTLTPFVECRFTLRDRQETSRTAGGVTRVKALGPAIWMAQFQSAPLFGAEARALLSWLDSLDGGAQTFTAYDVRHQFPASDPTGTHADTVQISSTASGAIALKGLPAGFVVTVGDWLSFATSTGRALHRVAEGATANGSGVTPAFAVRPVIRGAPAANTAVALKQPRGLWMMDPGSLRVEPVGGIGTQCSWTATQVP